MSHVEQRIQQIEKKIQMACERSGRQRSDVQVVAVTKRVSNERTAEVLAAGFNHLGENRPDGLMAKVAHIPTDVNWHFTGNLQSRRIRDIIHAVRYIHTSSRKSIAKEIQKHATHTVDYIPTDGNWHFIGNLQSRRIRDIIHDVRYIHSLSRKSIAKEIQRRATETVDCFVQVKVSGEASKSGLEPEEVKTFIESIVQ